jgi:hypothetical protein
MSNNDYQVPTGYVPRGPQEQPAQASPDIWPLVVADLARIYGVGPGDAPRGTISRAYEDVLALAVSLREDIYKMGGK